MFSNDIVDSDAFLEMPNDSQLLYFYLGMQADDDGFVTPKKVMRMIGSSEDNLKILIAKGFVISFETGIIVIRHWREHNYIRADRYNPTRYLEEKKKLRLDGNTYSVVEHGNQVAPVRQPMVAASKEVRKKESNRSSTGKNAENASMKRVSEFVHRGFKPEVQ